MRYQADYARGVTRAHAMIAKFFDARAVLFSRWASAVRAIM